MKKVFAFLSTLLLTIAFVGIFSTKAVQAAEVAEGKWIEDPTLAADEIPAYIEGNIYGTFPAYYDNNAKPVESYNYTVYPWNETRLRVAQINPDGTPTGMHYAVYFTGNMDATGKQGAGTNVLFWDVTEDGKATTRKSHLGTMSKLGEGNAYSPSFSTLRVNISGQDLLVDVSAAEMGANFLKSEYTAFYNSQIVFDGEGRIIRGLARDTNSYTPAEDGKATATTFAAEFCYVDGVGQRVAELENGLDDCDRVQVQVTEKGTDPETGEEIDVPVVDAEGNPVYEDGEAPKLITYRFVWEWFAEEPTNVNENGYLGEGWNPDLWDFCFEQDGGYMAVAFVQGANNATTFNVVREEEIAAYAQTLYAAALEANPEMSEKEKAAALTAAQEAAKNHGMRECVRSFTVPAGGWTYVLGYLDNGKGDCSLAFNSTAVAGYYYGRNAVSEVKDEEGNVISAEYMGKTMTYNFTAGALKYEDKVINGQSYQLLDGQNVVEVMQGEVFNPAQQINFDGIKKYWAVEGDLTSYSSSDEGMDFVITESVNGASATTKVEKSEYTSLEEVRLAVYHDIAEYWGIEYTEGLWTTAAERKFPKSSDAADANGIAAWATFTVTNKDNVAKEGRTDLCAFVLKDGQKFYDKWHWLFEKIHEAMLANPGTQSYAASLNHVKNLVEAGWAGSSDTLSGALWYYLNAQTHGYFGFEFANASYDWIDPTPTVEKWDAYEIDTTLSAPGDNWIVNYSVTNTGTGNSSSIAIKYVVVDSYTPILEVAKDTFIYTPVEENSKVKCDPIDKYSLVKAYDAQYNGVSILGNDISQYIKFETELDFDEPKEGTYEVKVSIKNNAGTKETVKVFTVKVLDITAPLAVFRNVTITQGEDFSCLDGIVLAYDAVDGNLFDANYKWWAEKSKAVDTTVVKGENGVYEVTNHTITVEIKDASNNVRSVSYKLTIVPAAAEEVATQKSLQAVSNAVEVLGATLDEVKDSLAEQDKAIAELAKALEALNTNVEGKFDAQADSVADVQAQVGAVAASVAALQTSVDEVADNTAGCGSGALLVLELAGAAALIALVLRKRH